MVLVKLNYQIEIYNVEDQNGCPICSHILTFIVKLSLAKMIFK